MYGMLVFSIAASIQGKLRNVAVRSGSAKYCVAIFLSVMSKLSKLLRYVPRAQEKNVEDYGTWEGLAEMV